MQSDSVNCIQSTSRSVAALWGALALLVAAHVAAAAPVQPWTASSPGVRVALAAIAGPPGVGGPVVHVSGPSGDGWNYARAPEQAVQQGQRYRLSLWLRIDDTGAATPAPYLKCEFLDAARKSLGRANSEIYDLGRIGTWQELFVEFAPPAHATSCYAALEKGVKSATEIDAYLAGGAFDIAVAPSAAAAGLPAVSGALPRLFLDAPAFEDLRARIQTSHASIWRDVQRRADRVAATPPPAYQSPTSADDEQLWQRPVGNAIPTLAIAYRLTGDARYLQAARAYALAAAAYPTWGAGKNDGVALAASHLLFGLSVAYDWLQADLDAPATAILRSAIAGHAARLYDYQSSGQGGSRPMFANSAWVRVSALGTAGFALAGEDPAATQWIDYATRYFQRVIASLGPDGASYEGVGYWGYAIEYLLKFLDLSSKLGGKDLYASDWLRQTAGYRLYLSLPQNAWTRTNVVVDIADSPRENWYGPDYSLRGLARRYRDPSAQWLAEVLDARDVTQEESIWLNLVWFDPTLEPAPPSNLPTLRHFVDMGIVSARSDWSGNESLLVFKSGPFAGHHVLDALAYDPGAFHVHPDANHFVLFGGGEWLIRDDGYGGKSTAQHNTLIVDGRGQLGEGGLGFNPAPALAARADPKILEARSTPVLDRISADAAGAYPASLGLEKAVRHVLFLKPDVLIVLDDVKTSKVRNLELHFHPEQPATRMAGDVFLARGPKTTLRIAPLTQDGVVATYDETQAMDEQQGSAGRLRTVRLSRAASAWRNAVVFSWGMEPETVTLMRVGHVWKFRAGERNVEFDWSTGEACAYRLGEPSSCGQLPAAPDLVRGPGPNAG